MLKVRRHEIPENNGLNMTPLMDIIFQLLVFFVLTSSLARPTQIELNLPESSSGVKAAPDKRLVVTYRLQADQPEITLNARPMESLESLGPEMQSLVGDEKIPVDIQIDRGVPYQNVVAVIDAVRDAGFARFSLLTLARKSTPAP